MKILGLDPGTATTGYGVIEISNLKSQNSKLRLVAYGTIKTKANSYMPTRLREIYLKTRKLITQYKPNKVALESLFFFKNQKTVMTVSQARGVIMMACQSLKVPIIEYPPLQVKNTLCQNGRASKKQMQNKIKKMLKLKEIPKPDDAADALAVAICEANLSLIKTSPMIPKNPELDKDSGISGEFETEKLGSNKLLYPKLSYQINGVLFKIYNELGGGYQEKYYQRAIESEFKRENIKYRSQVKADLSFKDETLGRYFIDFVIDGKIVLEIKVTPFFSQRDIKQVLGYLNKSGLDLGILASFTKNGVKTKRILRGF